MTFLSPWWLLALAALPLSVVGLVAWSRDRRRAARLYADPAVMDVRPPAGLRRARAAAAALAVLGVGFGAVAMARPAVDRTTKEERPSLVLAVDTSKSMLATDVAPSRLEAAKQAIRTLLDAAPDEAAIGLLTFNTGAQVLVPPVTDRAAVRRALDSSVIAEGTAIGDAVDAGVALLRSVGAVGDPGGTQPSPGRILLLTDGAQSAGDLSPSEGGELARAARVPVSGVLLGSDPGRPDQAPPDVTLSQLARQTGGIFTRSTSAADLSRVFEDIGSTLASVRRQDELTVYAALAMLALVALAGATLAAARLLPRVRTA